MSTLTGQYSGRDNRPYKRFTVSVHTGPSQVEEYAKRTGLTAGTERIYAVLHRKDRGDVVAATLDILRNAGFTTFSERDVRVTEWGLDA